MDHGDSDKPSGGPVGDRPATWEDIMQLPDSLGAEIVGGKIHYRAMTRARHGSTVRELGSSLPRNGSTRAPLGWWIVNDVDVSLGSGIYVKPDLTGWRKEALPELPDDWPVPIRPDWVCEVLSPTTAAYDRGAKASAYAQAGVPWYWIVDPVERTVEVLELVSGRWTICGVYTDGAQLAMPPFDDTLIEVSGLFLPLKGEQ